MNWLEKIAAPITLEEVQDMIRVISQGGIFFFELQPTETDGVFNLINTVLKQVDVTGSLEDIAQDIMSEFRQAQRQEGGEFYDR